MLLNSLIVYGETFFSQFSYGTALTADELFECVWPFCGVGAEGVKRINVNYFVRIEANQFAKPISCHLYLSIPHENIRKPLVFLCFPGVSKDTSGMKWVKKYQSKKWLYKLPANIYLYKVNNRNTRKRCEICSKLTIETPHLFHIFFQCFYYWLWTSKC